MNNEFSNLSYDEQDVIRKIRKEKLRNEVRHVFKRHILEVAHEYLEWNEGTGMCLSYSVFVNDFGYSEKNWKTLNKVLFDTKIVYSAVCNLINEINATEYSDFLAQVNGLYEGIYGKSEKN